MVRFPRAAGHFRAEVVPDESGMRAVAVRWGAKPRDGFMATHPGVYSLRTNLLDWTPEALWRTHTLLTDVEAVFRSLKSELGLRPVHQRTPRRAEGHLFITVLAYQATRVIRNRLADGRAVHIRRATRAEPWQKRIYDALGIDPNPGGIKRTIV